MMLLQNINIALRFLIEVSIVFLIGYWGFNFSNQLIIKFLLGIALPMLLMIFWGLFVAPKAPYLVTPFLKGGIEIVTIGMGILAMYHTSYHEYTIMYSIVAYVNLLFIYIWK